MIECVRAHVRAAADSNVSKFYSKLARKKENSVAAVAAASKLLRIVYYWVMKEKREYRS